MPNNAARSPQILTPHPQARRVESHRARIAAELDRIAAAGFGFPERIPAAVADAVLGLGEDLAALMEVAEKPEAAADVKRYVRRLRRRGGGR